MVRIVGCDVPKCWRPHWARGLCQMHYRRWYRHRNTGERFFQCEYVGPRRGRCATLVRTPGETLCSRHREQAARRSPYVMST
jgi:hypothetical protein